jgi:four helix bundle protein
MTTGFPDAERFGLSSQMRKAAASIPSNLAEGHRQRRASYVHHVVIALGSHAELETQVLLATRLGFVKGEDLEKFSSLSAQVGELAHGLLRALETQP